MGDIQKDTPGGLPAFKTHPMREAALGEVHARPFRPLTAPRVVLHYAFTTTPEEAAKDREWFGDFCAGQGAPGPGKHARYHVLDFAGGTLSWERHAGIRHLYLARSGNHAGTVRPLARHSSVRRCIPGLRDSYWCQRGLIFADRKRRRNGATFTIPRALRCSRSKTARDLQRPTFAPMVTA